MSRPRTDQLLFLFCRGAEQRTLLYPESLQSVNAHNAKFASKLLDFLQYLILLDIFRSYGNTPPLLRRDLKARSDIGNCQESDNTSFGIGLRLQKHELCYEDCVQMSTYHWVLNYEQL